MIFLLLYFLSSNSFLPWRFWSAYNLFYDGNKQELTLALFDWKMAMWRLFKAALRGETTMGLHGLCSWECNCWWGVQPGCKCCPSTALPAQALVKPSLRALSLWDKAARLSGQNFPTCTPPPDSPLGHPLPFCWENFGCGTSFKKWKFPLSILKSCKDDGSRATHALSVFSGLFILGTFSLLTCRARMCVIAGCNINVS